MIKKINKRLIVGLEIGSTKISTFIGELIDNQINIIGIGKSISKGINHSGINDLNSLTNCIKKSVMQAESMSGCQVRSTYLAISSQYIHCRNEIGIVPITKGEVTIQDIENVIYTAKSVRIENEHKILHVIPQEYSIDQQHGIKNPIGMSGIRMQSKVHLITCHKDISKNFVRATEICGIKVNKLIFSGLASSKAILTQEELDIGVCLVDIGGGTMDISIYNNGMIIHNQVIPYAGNIVTNDISYVFSIPLHEAEHIKINYGTLEETSVNSDEILKITIKNSSTYINNLTRRKLLNIIESRYTELLNLVNNVIINVQKKLSFKEENVQKLRAGVVLTGGGSKINALIQCANKIFQTKTRIGYPIKTNKSENKIYLPEYSTAIGLLIYGKKKFFQENEMLSKKKYFKRAFQKIRKWFKKEF